MIKNTKAKNPRIFSKKIIGLLLFSLIFPVVILAQEPEGVLLTGVFADSSNTQEQEILNQGVAKTFNLRTVWTYDQTDIITGFLGALLTAKNIATSTNGLEKPLLSEISGYQKKTIAHSAAVITAINLAKKGKLWGDELYLVSQVFISQDDLRQIRDLTSQGKGFNKIVLYPGDDIIPNFKELSINFKDYTITAKIREDLEVSLIKLVYEDRGRTVNVLEEVLKDFATRAKAQLGKEPVSVTIYGDIPGNKFEINWEDGTMESFNLQKDAQTGEDFQDEGNIKVVPLFDGFPHGRAQLEVLEEFYKKYTRMPGKEDLVLFKQITEEYRSKAEAIATQARDPNELFVSPEGNVKPGDTLTYTVSYENEGEGIAYGVYFTDTLEEDLDETSLSIGPVLDSATGQQIGEPGIYNPETRTITWFVGEVGSRQGGSAEFSVNVKGNTPDGSEIINYATVYFPSVPEATRTNGTVNRITTAIDTTPPTTTASVSPIPNQAGWNNSDVVVTLTAVDNEAGSGIAKTEYSLDNINWTAYASPFNINNEGTTKVYYESTDNAGNTESPKSLEIKLDKTPPVITSQTSPQPNSSGWNNTDVTVTFIAQDALSGIAFVTQPQTITTEGKDQHIGGQAQDLAGNTASTYITLSIDKTPPEVLITIPPEQVEYILNKAILTDWSVTDILSGIASATGTAPSGSSLDTATVGTKTFSVTATDNAGNKTDKTTTYYVRYSYSGILPPINPDGSSLFKLSRTIPVKFQLKDNNGSFISTAAVKIYLAKISNDVLGTEIEAESTSQATTGNLFRYDSTDNQYIFNLSTGYLSQGTWQIRISLDDGTSKYVNFGLK